MLLMTTRE